MTTIMNSLNKLRDFESIEVKEVSTILTITQLPGKGVLINIQNVDYFKNHVNMHSEAWENFLFRLIYDKDYRTKHAVNRRWYGLVTT